MKSIKSIVVALAMVLVVAGSADAQLRFGVKAGLNVSNLHFSEELLESDNKAGYNAGLMLECMLPIANIGVDASVMYVHRSGEELEKEDGGKLDTSRDYIEIPVNLKWKIGIPAVGSLVTPYIFTGPSFAFLTKKEDIKNAYENKTFDVAWNVGAGVQLFNKLQIGASYGFGLTKAVEAFSDDVNAAGIEGKNRYWTVTAAYLF
ncbi:MAG: PorT family protein [Muribaculaceae bacterium]|nr:PorT family protein [Muribaculaceae bacterium]